VGTPTAATMTITGPSNGDCQLISFLFCTGARLTGEFALNVPTSAINGAGLNSSQQNSFFPLFSVRKTTAGTNTAASMVIFPASGGGSANNQFKVAGLSASLSELIRLNF